MLNRQMLRHGSVIPLRDTESGDISYEDVPVCGHVEEDEFAKAFWKWHQGLPADLRQMIKGFEALEYGYGVWEHDINADAQEGILLYSPADFYVSCGFEFPVTMGKSVLDIEREVKDFEVLGRSDILGAFVGKSSCRYVYVAKPRSFSHEIIFAPGNRLALVDPQDLSLWDSLWRRYARDTG